MARTPHASLPEQFQQMAAIVGVLSALASIWASAAADLSYAVSTTYASYSDAAVSCQTMYGPNASLADFTATSGRQAILASCVDFGCWVATPPSFNSNLTLGGGLQACPYVFAPAGYPPPTNVQVNVCAMYQRFVCAYTAAASPPPSPPTPPSPPPTPAPLPHPPLPLPRSSPPAAGSSVTFTPDLEPPSPPGPNTVLASETPSPPHPPSPHPPSPHPPSPHPPSPFPSPRHPSPPPPSPPSPEYSDYVAPVEYSPTDYSPTGSVPVNSPRLVPSPVPAPPQSPVSLQSQYVLLNQLSMVVAVHLAHIPGTDTYLYMERPSGYHPDGSHVIAGSLDVSNQHWTNLNSPDGLFCCGHTLMANGSVSIVGGHVANAGYPAGIMSIRTYTAGQPSLYKVTNMRYPRWYPTATLLPTRQIMIMGGTQGVGAGTAGNPYYEIWDPENPMTTQQLPVNPTFLKSVKQNYYPFNFVLPSGDMWSYCGRIGWIINPYTAAYLVPVPNRPLSVVSPRTVYTTQYPYTGTSLMLPLRPSNNYAVEIMVMGGQDVTANVNLSIPACSESLRIKLTQTGGQWVPNGTYNFNGGWVQEFTGSSRVMSDAIVLPNGYVIMLNGAQQGLAGDSSSGGGSRANYPNFFAEMYNPNAAVGNRWITLARSQIARLYHSTAALTTNGTILVTGCDRCFKIISNLNFSMPLHKAEYRNEIFYPPFWYNTNKPVIVTWPSVVTYNQTFTVTFTGTVTSAVLVAPSSTTHCFNTNQRVVELVMAPQQAGSQSVVLTAPPTVNIAPAQMYMLFLLNGDSYSRAKWVTLQEQQ